MDGFSKMRVLVVTRDDHDRVFGGDTVMIRKLEKHLKPMGISFLVTTADRLPDPGEADIVHLTFLHSVESVERTAIWADRSRLPVLISPLFEEPLYLWFEWAVQQTGKWQQLSLVLGRRITQKLYVVWQAARAKRQAQWQRQRELLMSMHIVPNSRYELNHLKKWFDLPDLDATVIAVGVDTDVFDGAPADCEISELGNLAGYVLEVGRIETRKNQLGLLHALRGTPTPIVFLGQRSRHEHEQAYVRACEAMAKERGNVLFLEHLPEKVLPTLLGRASVHVLPSWSERPGLVTLEAAACGCKVVSTSCSPIYEYLGDDAWYCRPDHVGSIRRAVEHALIAQTPPGLKGRVLTEYTWKQTALRLGDVYSRAICHPR